MTTGAWCFQCGAEYNEDVLVCVECAVPTVDHPPTDVTTVGTEDEEQLAYDLHEWAAESRVMLESLLTGADVMHAWQGASLIVREADEDAVDELVDQVEEAAAPTLDPDAEKTVYELEEYDDEQLTRLTHALGAAGIAHDFTADGELVVLSSDEEGAEAVFDRLDETADQFGPGVDGVDAHTVITEMFLIVDKLRRGAGDARVVRSFLDHVELAEQLRLPFGFETADWRGLLAMCGELRDLLADREGDDDELLEKAAALRDRLHVLV
ncbi:MAG: hypothetical protein RIE08_05660 [Acidimicrobiales bacterium]